jgi:DNA-directed RNA polymerase specialized sigma24 family protein
MNTTRENISDDTQARFGQTHWSNVLLAASQHMPGAQEALEQLCKIYWPPLYAFLRKQGQSPENAKDLTQGFFAHLLGGNRLLRVHPEKGKFRSFLLACLNNYVRNEWDKQNAEKRGGGQIDIPIDIHDAETGLGFEPSDKQDSACIFERKWASVLLQIVLEQLREKHIAAGKIEMFETLQPFISGEAGRGDYSAAAARLNLSAGAARVAATRLREEFRAQLRAEVGRTVSSASEIDDEIRHLLRVFRNP